jgi:hypothetical protein
VNGCMQIVCLSVPALPSLSNIHNQHPTPNQPHPPPNTQRTQTHPQSQPQGAMPPPEAFIHGAELVFLDGLGLGLGASAATDSAVAAARARARRRLLALLPEVGMRSLCCTYIIEREVVTLSYHIIAVVTVPVDRGRADNPSCSNYPNNTQTQTQHRTSAPLPSARGPPSPPPLPPPPPPPTIRRSSGSSRAYTRRRRTRGCLAWAGSPSPAAPSRASTHGK